MFERWNCAGRLAVAVDEHKSLSPFKSLINSINFKWKAKWYENKYNREYGNNNAKTEAPNMKYNGRKKFFFRPAPAAFSFPPCCSLFHVVYRSHTFSLWEPLMKRERRKSNASVHCAMHLNDITMLHFPASQVSAAPAPWDTILI